MGGGSPCPAGRPGHQSQLHRVVDRGNDALEIPVNLLHAKTQDIITLRLETGILGCIAPSIVRWTVDLDNQPKRFAAIIDEVSIDDMLAAKRRPELAVAQTRPQASFRFRNLAPELARKLRLFAGSAGLGSSAIPGFAYTRLGRRPIVH